MIFTYIARISDERDIDRLLILLADMGRDLIGADRCTVWLLNPKTDDAVEQGGPRPGPDHHPQEPGHRRLGGHARRSR